MKKTKFLVILSGALLAFCGLVVPGVILAQGQPQGEPKGIVWQAINGLEERIDNEGMPVGAIIMWSGEIDPYGNPVIGGTADTNWQICDGSNGTPDLRDRFVVGSGYSYLTDDVGGENSVTLTASEMPGHNHSLSGTTSEDGGHSHILEGGISPAGRHLHSFAGKTWWEGRHRHTISDRYSYGENLAGLGVTYAADNSWYNNFESTSEEPSHRHDYSGNTTYAANHVHYDTFSIKYRDNHTHYVSGNTRDTGGNSSHENRPLYYALAFIMKIQ